MEGGFIYTYRLHRSSGGAGPASLVCELVHKTSLEEIPYAMCAFQGKVLIGVGKLLRLYDLGKKKLLRKSENKVNEITSLFYRHMQTYHGFYPSRGYYFIIFISNDNLTFSTFRIS